MRDIEDWLAALINFNTTWDTGNEKECAEYIRNITESYGIETEIWTAEKNRCSLSARVPGKRRETLVLHAHMDTAEYGPEEGWKFSPRQALVKNGLICGRGALDCKSQLAVWLKILTDVKQMERPEYSLMLLATADEECGGACGLGWLAETTDILKDVFLVIGEGGGFPFPFQNKLYYTFQTGEREDEACEDDGEAPLKTLDKGIEKGYYSPDIKEYFLRAGEEPGRKLDIFPLYAGMKKNFERMENSAVYQKYGGLFCEALKEHCPAGALMPVITPGFSDNRYFRRKGIPTIGFFPLDKQNGLSGIHGKNEYISEKSLFLAYNVIKKIILKLLLTL